MKPIAKGGNGQIFKLAVDSTFAVDQGIRHVAVKVSLFAAETTGEIVFSCVPF